MNQDAAETGEQDALALLLPSALVDTFAARVTTQVAGMLDVASQAAERVAREERMALRVPEAAAALGISEDSFQRHVLPEVKAVRCGTLRLIPARELLAWLDRNAAFLGERA